MNESVWEYCWKFDRFFSVEIDLFSSLVAYSH